jgi:hypothetical protein
MSNEIVDLALAKAKAENLDLSAKKAFVPINAFVFHLLQPSNSVTQAFKGQLLWPDALPIPILTYHQKDKSFGIMDGMLRIRGAQLARLSTIPAYIASGETYDALESILDRGYYGEDFVELLCLVNAEVRKNQEGVNRNRLAGL